MRTLLTVLCLVALCHARPENAASPAVPEFDSGNVQTVLKFLPRITESIKGDGDTASGIRRVSDTILEIVKESAPEDRRQQAIDAAQVTNAILDSVAELVKDLPPFDVTKFEVPEIVIPKVEIPDIPDVVIPEFKVPEIVIPDFKIPNFEIDDSFKVDIPEIVIPEVTIPKFNIPDIPEFKAPEIDIPKF